MLCQFCSEEIADSAIKCKHCGEFLNEGEGGRGQPSGGMSTVLKVFLGSVAAFALFGFLCIAAAIVIPNVSGGPLKHGNETGAIRALEAIGTVQSLFREADKEADGNLDYGTLQELGSAGTYGLIDTILASGTKNGYLFEVTYSSETSEFLWMATARPARPGTTGDRYFATNHEGVTFYDLAGPIPLDAIDCTIPAQLRPIGR